MTFCLGKEDLMMIHLLKTPLALTLRSLALSFDDSKYAATDIYLNTKASSGLDVGYDAGTFANQAGSLGLYSFLADGSHPETKLAIQAVSNNISDPVVIPLGVNAQSGIDYTIKLKEKTTTRRSVYLS